MQDETPDKQPPMFNIHPVIGMAFVLLIGVHIVRVWLLPSQYEEDFILLLAAIPARYGEAGGQWPYAFAAWYTPLSYGLVHADWVHLGFNLLWMLAFGSPVAMRLGTLRFIALALAGTFFAFVAHLVSNPGDHSPLIGASGAVSAFMGAAIRLPRQPGMPILPLLHSFSNRGFVAFIVVWFGFNLLVGLYPGLIAAEDTRIAWQAHVGGFLTGLLLLKWFDNKGRL